MRTLPLLTALALTGCAADATTTDLDAEAIARAGRVSICHYTDSETNPYNIITVSENALDAHLDHGDMLPGDWYPDADGDGFGDAGATPEPCPLEDSDVLDGSDCDDDDAAVNPDAEEVCDEIDNDCDAEIDEGDVCGPECEVIADFESGTWPESPWTGGGTVVASGHDSSYGLNSNASWSYETFYTAGATGDIVSMWILTNGASSGRAYLGFDASASGAKSFVAAPNTGDIRFQTNNGYGYTELNTSAQGYASNTWYLMEAEFLGGGMMEGRLYADDGVTLLNTVTQTYGSVGTGGLAIRAFSGIIIDDVTVCTAE